MQNDDFMIKGIEVPGTRERLFEELLELMDARYQMLNWPVEKGGYGFHTQIGFAMDMIFEELDMDGLLEGTDIKESVGSYLRNNKEKVLFLELGKIMNALFDDVGIFKGYITHGKIAKDKEYLSSPYLSPMRKAAKECFALFMSAEKKNKEFCDFVLKVIMDEKRFTSDESKSSYENIVNYINSITAF